MLKGRARRRGTARAARDQPQRREHHGTRYGRADEARQAALEAADNLLSEMDFATVTMEGLRRVLVTGDSVEGKFGTRL
jgi:hypothetical protein